MRGLIALLLAAATLLVLPALSCAQEVGDEWTEPITGMEFVWVPGGCYEMGCGEWAGECWDDEYPVHEVCVDGFWMGKYEVTEGQWNSVIGSIGYNNIEYNYPVEYKTWEDAQLFIKRLKLTWLFIINIDLPTEAQWEYACRSGGRNEMYSGGNNIESVAWYYDNAELQRHSVGTKYSNILNLYDMSGNVSEWVQDWYYEDAYLQFIQSETNLINESQEKVLRGGCWLENARFSRCSNRASMPPQGSRYPSGFRLVIQ